MLENLKSTYIFNIIINLLLNKRKLNIFRYNKFFQNKIEININNYLYEFIENNSIDINDGIFIYKKPDKEKYNNLLKRIKNKKSNKKLNYLLKENIIKYIAMRDDFNLSINHIFFIEILKEKILLGKKQLKIILEFGDDFSQNNIVNLISQKSNKINDYIEEYIEFHNDIIKKLEFLYNCNIPIKSLAFNGFYDMSYFCIKYKADKIEYKSNQTDEEKNILINYKLKRGEIVNKILEKNCKYITEMKYITFEKYTSNKNKPIFPLLGVDKFENLSHLDLNILFDDRIKKELIFNFTDKIYNLKELNIKGSIVNSYDTENYILSLYLPKNILDKLEILEIENVNWFVHDDESFDFININKLHIKNCLLAKKYNIQKKYFFEELLKGNIKWKKLKELNIEIMFEIIPKLKEEYINKEIINFIQVSNKRENYEKSTSQFFPDFFKFIFNNQILYIKTKENNINIDNFIISLYDNVGCYTCEKKPIKYQKNGKCVNIEVEGILYGECFLGNYLRESALKYINLDIFNINPDLDDFTIDHLTLDQLKQIKMLSSEHFKKIKNFKTFSNNLDNLNINDLKNILNELSLREKFLEGELDNIKIYNNKGFIKENYFDNKIKSINFFAYNHEKDTIKEIIKKLEEKIKNYNKVNEKNETKVND